MFWSSDVQSAVNAAEGVQGGIYPQFGSTSVLQVRFADLEISELDSKADSSATTTDEVSKGLTMKNLSLASLKISGDLEASGIKFNSCFVNPEPICVSNTSAVIVPGCSIIEGEIEVAKLARFIKMHRSLDCSVTPNELLSFPAMSVC